MRKEEEDEKWNQIEYIRSLFGCLISLIKKWQSILSSSLNLENKKMRALSSS